jgi:hypothetical protein
MLPVNEQRNTSLYNEDLAIAMANSLFKLFHNLLLCRQITMPAGKWVIGAHAVRA